jgi:ribonuclease D
VFRGPRQRRQVARWFAAVRTGSEQPTDELPALTSNNGDGIPPASRWRDRDPVAAARLARARDVVVQLAEAHDVLAQNLLASDVIRRLAWEPPDPLDEAAVRARLAALDARPWQIDLTAGGLTAALAAPPEVGLSPDG